MAHSLETTAVDFPLGKSPVATVGWGYYYAGSSEQQLGLDPRLVLQNRRNQQVMAYRRRCAVEDANADFLDKYTDIQKKPRETRVRFSDTPQYHELLQLEEEDRLVAWIDDLHEVDVERKATNESGPLAETPKGMKTSLGVQIKLLKRPSDYHESREAEEGVPRTRYLEDMRNWQVTEYERRVTAEDANRRYFQSSRSHPRERKPSAVRFFGETTFIYNPRKSIREINMAGYELVGVFTSRMTGDEVIKARRRLYKRPEDF
ncbi:hypothetical protein KNSL1_010423 [Colletotrichum chrysophilum]|nr:hypothetical protein KNSL1_010423 [Colletotrichum chrysophilum]